MQGRPEFLNRLERPHVQKPLLERADEPLGTAIALGCPYEGRARLDAEERRFSSKRPAHVLLPLSCRIRRPTATSAGYEPKYLGTPLPNRLEGLEARGTGARAVGPIQQSVSTAPGRRKSSSATAPISGTRAPHRTGDSRTSSRYSSSFIRRTSSAGISSPHCDSRAAVTPSSRDTVSKSSPRSSRSTASSLRWSENRPESGRLGAAGESPVALRALSDSPAFLFDIMDTPERGSRIPQFSVQENPGAVELQDRSRNSGRRWRPPRSSRPCCGRTPS